MTVVRLQCQLWIVHDKPLDFPNEFVARKWIYQAHGMSHTETIVKSTSLEMVRAALKSKGLKRWKNPPEGKDRASQIVEFWTDLYKFPQNKEFEYEG